MKKILTALLLGFGVVTASYATLTPVLNPITATNANGYRPFAGRGYSANASGALLLQGVYLGGTAATSVACAQNTIGLSLATIGQDTVPDLSSTATIVNNPIYDTILHARVNGRSIVIDYTKAANGWCTINEVIIVN